MSKTRAPTRRTAVAGLCAGASVGWLVPIADFGRRALAQEPSHLGIDLPPIPGATAAQRVRELARALAAKPFSAPKLGDSDPIAKLTYDQFRDIRFRGDRSIWRDERLGYELQLLPVGWLYKIPVEVFTIEADQSRKILAEPGMFDLGPLAQSIIGNQTLGLSGFRVHGPINRSDYLDEYLVFQGASYFRAVGRGQGYGLSARGLAINTARPEGEEFPFFRGFYIEKPKQGAPELVMHALLDSQYATGAYRFVVRPGPATVMEVEATLYPRVEIAHVGLAPMTSMFLHGPAGRRLRGDFRPAVHDSEGLAIHNGNGERIWRPLTNPRTLQASAFLDRDPKGFGLVQRDRAFASFEDLEARYESRPSLWVEPIGEWGQGAVELIEIPVDEEIHDNIVAFWRPAAALKPGVSHAIAYRLTWGDQIPSPLPGARVRKTHVGSAWRRQILFVVDFDGPGLKANVVLPTAHVSASSGTIANVVVQRHPEIGGVRCSFELLPDRAEVSELRLQLKNDDRPISETWLYRWTKT